MKKLIAMLLVVAMMLGVMAGCNETEDTNATDPTGSTGDGSTAADQGTYTYNSYMSALATNWNPHTWEMNNDSTVLGYLEAPLADISVKDSAAGEYQWIFVAATDIKDVTADHQDDLVKYGAAETDATSDYVYEISLREGLCWQDGTPINADTYIYSMKQLLDPKMKNYRANNYYSGESAIAGASEYYFQGSVAYDTDNSTDGTALTAALADLVKGDDGVYTMADGTPVAFSLTSALNYLGVYYLYDYYDAGYISKELWDAMDALATAEGFMPVTDESIAALYAFTGSDTWGNEPQESLAYYMYSGAMMPEADYDATVGLYKVDDYTIRYVCDVAYSYYYFLTSCTSNWLVHEETYEACKATDPETGLITSTYNTSVDTTMSYGAYKLTVLEDNKQMVFEQNEKYFEYTADANGNLSSTTETIGFKVDGEYQPQYKTQKIVYDVMTDDAAKLAFLSGELDDWSLSAEDAITYSTSEQLYQVDETYTMRLFFNTNLGKLKQMDTDGTNVNGVVLSNDNFRKAFSLAINRAEFVTATAGFKPAYYLINSLYYYDVYEDPASVYRNTDQAKQAVCNIYGVEYGEGKAYATLDEAYASITGYNLTEAQALMKTACDELVAEGLYKAGDDITIAIALTAGAADAADQQQMALLNQYIQAAAEGSGFGKITLTYLDNLTDRYGDVANGVYAIGRGAWGGAAFYPFTMFRCYCDPSYAEIHEGGCYDPTTETLTMNINGEDVTMTWQEWSQSMSGTGVYANADNETKLAVLAGIEENFIEQYYCIPLCTYTACSMLSYKMNYFTENYSIMYGFGGLRLMTYNYSDAEWDAFVTEQGGNLGY